jgi:hypothetical protein
VSGLPRPGPHPVLHWAERTPAAMAEWRAYAERSDDWWAEAAARLGRLVPCQGLEYIGGGQVLTVVYEDRSYAWLGGCEARDGDGPWAFGDCNWAGGYRYDPDSCGEVFTDRAEEEVEDPDDVDSAVRALAAVARRLADMPFVNSA